VTLPVMTKGFGLIFKHCLGSVATTTPGGGTNTRDHECLEGAMDGLSWTVQVGRTDNTGTTQAFTYAGCKVANWELSNDTSGVLMLKLGIDGMSETTDTALASASYPSSILPFSFVHGSITLAGSAYDVKDWTLSADNGLASDRYFIRSTTPASKKEQLEGGSPREYTGNLTAEWSGITAYDRFVDGTTAAITMTYANTTTAIEGTFYPTITVDIPTARFDGETPTVTGPELLDQPLPFKVLDDDTDNSPVSITVRSVDATA
jgi:hypothetical protein